MFVVIGNFIITPVNSRLEVATLLSNQLTKTKLYRPKTQTEY